MKHLGTTIQTTFIEFNEAGDVKHAEPLKLEIRDFTEAEFVQAFHKLREARAKLEQNVTASTS